MNEKTQDTLRNLGCFLLGSLLTYGITKRLGMASVKPVLRSLGNASRDIARGTGKVDKGLSKLKGYL